MDYLQSPVWRLSACLESGVIFNIHFIMQNLSKLLLKLKLGNFKVLQITSQTLHKILLIMVITMSYSLLHMSSGDRDPEVAMFFFTYSYADSPRLLTPSHTSFECP